MKLSSSKMQWIQSSIVLLALVFSPLWADEAVLQTKDSVKGQHGGRLLEKGHLALELTIFEHAMSPHFRAYIYQNGVLVSPDQSQLEVQLKRFNHGMETVSFKPIDDFLQSEQIIREPHSFDVVVDLNYQGKKYSWHYSSYEGRVKIVPALLKAAHIKTAQAASVTIEKQLKVVGKIVPNHDTMAPVYPRYSGIIKLLTKNLGDEVTKGELLVTVESNESLQNYSILAPISGTVVQKYATTGELAKGDKPIYEIANLANVWADLTLYRKDAPLVRQGMSVVVTGDEGKPQSRSLINYISPLGIEDSQTTLARAILPNAGRIWLPGMYVNAVITIEKKTVPVAVPHTALQRMQDHDVVFVQQGDFFEATPVILGEEDDQWVEIKSGLEPGQYYVSDNSFFLKAEIGKEGAIHDH